MRIVSLIAALVFVFAVEARAQTVSNCQAIARALPHVVLASTRTSADQSAYEVEIRYVGHSSFRITAPDGTTIVTDYSGRHGAGGLPDVVTMNHAHITHWTPNPDPGIAHALRGWSDAPGGADHFLTVGEALIRNVPTDIRTYAGREENGNSIFIFEIAGLCIGHLGHLHQVLSDEQYAAIGRLDIVFVPIDGTHTMNHAAMMEVVARLRASIAIPMHWFSRYTLAQFVTQTDEEGLDIEMRSESTLRVSLNSLPDRPTMVVLPRELPF